MLRRWVSGIWTGEREGKGRFTGWMGGFKDPVCVLGVGYYLVMPLDLEMAGGLLEEGRAREGVDV